MKGRNKRYKSVNSISSEEKIFISGEKDEIDILVAFLSLPIIGRRFCRYNTHDISLFLSVTDQQSFSSNQSNKNINLILSPILPDHNYRLLVVT